MLYKQNQSLTLSDKLFQNPTSEYRGTPFWAWNDLLTKNELERQIDVFREMGLGGFHMHVRTGLKNRYLSDDYMALVKDCVNKAKENNMLAWLYDEDRWPSGAAGGMVTKDPRYRARALYFTNDETDAANLANGDRLLACYDVSLGTDGTLQNYRRIEPDEAVDGKKWFALLKISTPSSWYNGQTYADTLNKEAIEQFIKVTHERYKATVGDAFGETVPAIFTDEPQFTRKTTLDHSDPQDIAWVRLPWTDKVPELYKDAYGEDLLASLPELFWELPDGKNSVVRYHYHDFIAELFAQSFADTVGSWCRQNGIALTGHMMEEPTLTSQSAALGEAMRSYRSFQLPGIDMLCNNHEFTTAKQAQSAAHQFGYEGVLSELYGVTSWDADFRLYKHQGDWQAALGVTVRVPHLSWYSMQGEAKRDYPASISYQSPWYKQWHLVEDHFARVNTAMTRGKAKINLAVIHPVESFWLHWGPNDKTAVIRDDMNERFLNLTKWLLEGTIDFNFVSESLLPQLCEAGTAPLRVGEMQYDTVLVPACETLRSSTLERLEGFRKAGGRLIFLGNAPTLENAVPSARGKALFDQSEQVPFARAAVLDALDDTRLVSMRSKNGELTNEFLYQLRTDTDGDWLFIAHTREPDNKDLRSRKDVILTLRGDYIPTVYDTATGKTCPIGADYQNGTTIIKTTLHGYDSLLLKLTPGRTSVPAAFREPEYHIAQVIPAPASFRRTEPNVLLLDMAAYAVDGGDFQETEEILRLDNKVRRTLGMPARGGQVVQPYIIENKPPVHTVTLRFEIDSEIDVAGAYLALEDADVSDVMLNREPVKTAADGNFVDIAIQKVPLPVIRKGKNVLTVTQPFGERTNTEAMYLLGDFGVRVVGTQKTIVPEPAALQFGDLAAQGYPFYGGAIQYMFDAPAKNGRLTLRASDYRGGLLKVSCDGKDVGAIIYPPYTLTIDDLADGMHTVTLTAYLHRYNTFGPVHIVNEQCPWYGPDSWRTCDEDWSYQYHLRQTGVLKSPELLDESC